MNKSSFTFEFYNRHELKKCTSGTLGVFSTEITTLAMASAGANEKNAAEDIVYKISYS